MRSDHAVASQRCRDREGIRSTNPQFFCSMDFYIVSIYVDERKCKGVGTQNISTRTAIVWLTVACRNRVRVENVLSLNGHVYTLGHVGQAKRFEGRNCAVTHDRQGKSRGDRI